MAAIEVLLFQEKDGGVPLLEWLDGVRPKKALAKCLALVELLKEMGAELRRPHADSLRDGIHELRTRFGKVRLRMLYFFHGQAAVISHGFAKASAKVDPKEIDRALRRKVQFAKEPKKHSYQSGGSN